MGHLFDALCTSRAVITTFLGPRRSANAYKKFDLRWKEQLHSYFHAPSYILNLYYMFFPSTFSNENVMCHTTLALNNLIANMISTPLEQAQVMLKIGKLPFKPGCMGSEAVRIELNKEVLRYQIEAPAIGIVPTIGVAPTIGALAVIALVVVVPAIDSSSSATEIRAVVVRVCSQLEEHGKILLKLDDHGKMLHTHGKMLERILMSTVGDSTLPLGDTPLIRQYQFSTPEKIAKPKREGGNKKEDGKRKKAEPRTKKVVPGEILEVVNALMVDDDVEVEREVNFNAILFEYGDDLLEWKKGDKKDNDDKKDVEEKVKSEEEKMEKSKNGDEKVYDVAEEDESEQPTVVVYYTGKKMYNMTVIDGFQCLDRNMSSPEGVELKKKSSLEQITSMQWDRTFSNCIHRRDLKVVNSKLILIPRNINDSHWVRCVVSFKARKICIYDSMVDLKISNAQKKKKLSSGHQFIEDQIPTILPKMLIWRDFAHHSRPPTGSEAKNYDLNSKWTTRFGKYLIQPNGMQEDQHDQHIYKLNKLCLIEKDVSSEKAQMLKEYYEDFKDKLGAFDYIQDELHQTITKRDQRFAEFKFHMRFLEDQLCAAKMDRDENKKLCEESVSKISCLEQKIQALERDLECAERDQEEF
ncbi:hypothetical protein GIB67_016217 [Kingdonia uniflora]|uniref:Ubiquitin-like protease family profile domain-containing protein n=1 Tax=Kingdonia uniflora TaxID=39325 RepID=A0A7J7LT80_9MAGN|nr:hypothetical protein GIB67_016217 [Kingdonia uniflora]